MIKKEGMDTEFRIVFQLIENNLIETNTIDFTVLDFDNMEVVVKVKINLIRIFNMSDKKRLF